MKKRNSFVSVVSLALLLFLLNFHSGSRAQAATTIPPAPLNPVPSSKQVSWQNMDMYAFIHFGMNTFTDKEWGDGTDSPSLFNPTQLDANQWVTVLKNAGFKMIILTAKHHDGFTLWPSAYTNYGVKSSPWKNGQGDVVKELAEAARAQGIKFGIYLSPWDRHEPTYGSGEAYNQFYMNQLRELLTNYGEISEVWWDGAKGDNTPQTYDFKAWSDLVHQLQPNAVIFGGSPYNDVRWVGNENGLAPDTMWSKVDASGTPSANGVRWLPSEADVSIRPGWFYHQSQDSSVKSLSTLVDIYNRSVGHNATLLMNVPPDRRGLITDYDKNRLVEFRSYLDNVYNTNLAADAVATATETRGTLFAAGNMLDQNENTYWSTSDGVTNASITVNLGSAKAFDIIRLQEYIPLGQRVTSFHVEVYENNAWKTVYTGVTIGHKKLITFPTVIASQIRVNITGAQASPTLHSIGIHKSLNTGNPADLAYNKPTAASNVHSSGYIASYATDGNSSTRWATSDGTTSAWLQVDFGAPTTFNKTVITQLGQRISSYHIQYYNGTGWVNAYTGGLAASTQSDMFPRVTASSVRLQITNGSNPSLYSFEVLNVPDPNENLALNKLASASNFHSSTYGPEKSVDGNTGTRWATSDNTSSAWLQIEFGGKLNYNKVKIDQFGGTRIKDFQIQYFDGVNWVNAYSGTNPAQIQTLSFPVVNSDKIRLNISSRNGSLGPTINEFSVYMDPSQ
ncbi:alpha-L-fucosidase [Paenibacillus silviterrae]|uniref:alpha-L-fucosidase n=1 Tax=Paenibacillus silviterrae TaxID=3242194 RepID=UPI002543672B|nr:discoidin domain-containing protein [Paenibacillus chinjuensis]